MTELRDHEQLAETAYHAMYDATASYMVKAHFEDACLHMIGAIAAAREVTNQADDALMLNTNGHVASTTIANIFLLMGETLVTPADDQGLLKGIARATLIASAKELGLHVQARIVKPEELHAADAVFLTNSLRLATHVSSIDGKTCGTRDISFVNTFFERNMS